MTTVTDRVAPATHPLDPLSEAELGIASEAIHTDPRFDDRMLFVSVGLEEPPKERVLAGVACPREALAVLLDPREGAAYEVIVSVDDATVRAWRRVTGIQPSVTATEIEECVALVRADPRFRQALRDRGITDPDLVQIEPWSMGGFERPEEVGRRLAWTLCFLKRDPQDNAYAHPIEGLFAIVDLNRMEIVRFEEYGARPIPQQDANYTPEAVGTLRTDLKSLEIVQPEGPSFEIDGWELHWQKWRIHIGFTPREGLVFHTVGYEDGGRIRPILYRASFAELVVPYGDPNPSGYRRNAFDIGEYGIGPYTNSLSLGCDCLGEIRYLDAHLCDNRGEPYTIHNAICIHEEDAGILWKHTDTAGRVEVRRSRRLVISSVVTVDNYEYAFYWYFYQDGTIEAELKLTGIVVTALLEAGETSPYGRRVAPELMAPNHQHFFTARLDMMVDGVDNTVFEVHTEAPPAGPQNPYGGAFVTVATPLQREQEAQQDIDPLAARFWRISNANVRNGLGEPVAYRLMPGDNVLPFALPDAPIAKRIGFLRKNLWVTPYQPDERFPGGHYPNQHPEGDGLPVWTRANRPIDDTDVVVWYNVGNQHTVRPEDWPVMPVTRIGFMLKPDGFFDRNPALDVPPPEHADHCETHG